MTHELTGYLIKVRSRAVSAGMAYKIEATSYGRLVALVSNRCDDRQWREDPQLTLHLPQGVELDAPNGSICYTSQGSSDRAERFALHTPTGRSRTIEIRESGEFNIL